MRENTTTEPTMLSARNFPGGRVGGQKAGRSPVSSKASVRPRLTKGVDVQLVNEIPQPLDHVLHLLHALPLWGHGRASGDDARGRKTTTETALEWWDLNSRPRRRSPQCTASLCGGRGRCRRPGRMGSRCRLSFCSTFCRSAPSLRTRSDDADASAVLLPAQNVSDCAPSKRSRLLQ